MFEPRARGAACQALVCLAPTTHHDLGRRRSDDASDDDDDDDDVNRCERISELAVSTTIAFAGDNADAERHEALFT